MVCIIHIGYGNTCETLQNRRSIYISLSIVAPLSIVKLSNELINKYCIRFNANNNMNSASGIRDAYIQCTLKTAVYTINHSNGELFYEAFVDLIVTHFGSVSATRRTNRINTQIGMHTPYESFIQTVWSQPTATVHVFCCVLLAISSIKYIIFCFNFSHQHHLTLVTLNNFSTPNRDYFNYYYKL